jgi:excisionase family DNA binding protein
LEKDTKKDIAILKMKTKIITLEYHEKIRKAYESRKYYNDGSIGILAKEIGVSDSALSKYALKYGFRKKCSVNLWTDKEIELLRYNRRLSNKRIQQKLQEDGYQKSLRSIKYQKHKLRLKSQINGMTLQQAADCLGITRTFLRKLIRAGKLKAKPRGSDRTEKQNGDYWYIKDKDIKSLLVNYTASIDFSKIDKYWLVDVLTGVYD